MKILHVTPSFFPATKWGGPIQSTKAICDGIHATPGFDLRVLTTDAASPDLNDRVIPAALPYQVDFTRRMAGHSISPGMLARLPGAIAWADVVHLTATYNFPTLPTLTLAKLLRKPVVWSPRGALQARASWADAPRKGPKALFEKVAQLGRPDDTILHVTSKAEACDSVEHLSQIDTALIPNCVDIPHDPKRPVADRKGLHLLYLGRLHPKKGLEQLFGAMTQLPDHVVLDVCGTGDAAYVNSLRGIAAPLSGRIRLHGHVEGAAKERAFANADLFVLPSYSENFGIVVAEALAHAVPVLTTNGTPWQALDHQGCGRCADLDGLDLAQEISTLTKADLHNMGTHGRNWMRRDFSAAAMTRSFAVLYRGLVRLPQTPVMA